MARHVAPAPAGPVRWLGGVVLWMVILGLTAAIAAAVVAPRLMGATPYTVLTGSMRPTMPPGTLIVVDPVPAQDIGVGNVITYQLRSGDPTVVTHRVVSVGVNGKGESIFRTQGDANDVVDERAVQAVQVKGVVRYAVPHLGRASAVITGEQRRLVTAALAVGLAVYALAMFAGAVRGRGRRTASRSPRGYAHG